jgi:cysteine desulfurase
MRIYLDHNATTPLDPRVQAAVVENMERAWANPSSTHEEGRTARDAVETARARVAALVGGASDEVIFTSGGTEADALGIIGLARMARASGRPAVALAPAIEHPAVLGSLAALEEQGFEIRELSVDGAGAVELADLEAACRDGVALVALSLANHELGTLQEMAGLARLARDHGALVHCDAVQAAGKLPIDVVALNVDALAVSAHKIYGPKGVGALWLARRHDISPLVASGHQERGRRGGTENVPGIVGLGEAARLAAGEGLAAQAAVAALRARLERGLEQMDGVRIHGAAAARVSNTTSAGFDGALGDVIATSLDLAGIAVSTGAACTSGSVKPSPVLLALGLSEERAAEVVRFSLGLGTTEDDIKVLLEALPAIVSRARKFR